MWGLLGRLGGWAKDLAGPVLMAVGAALLVWSGYKHMDARAARAEARAEQAQAQLERERAAWAQERAKLLEQALAAERRAREIEAEMARAAEEVADARRKDQERVARSVAAFNDAAYRLRNAIRNYTAADSAGGSLTAAECGARLGAAGHLLEGAVRLAVRRTADAERLNADAARMLEERRALTCGP